MELRLNGQDIKKIYLFDISWPEATINHALWLTLAKISNEGLTELSLRKCWSENAEIDSWLINKLAAKTATRSLKNLELQYLDEVCEKTREDFA